MTLEEISDKITQILRPVESIDYVFLFGSALGRLLPQSDIDILIGGEMDFNQKMLLTAELSIELSRKVDMVFARESRCELVLKAMSRGLVVFTRNKEKLKQDYIANWRYFDNGIGLRNIRFSRIQREYIYGR
jgi:predicted nucleotidyltransferase